MLIVTDRHTKADLELWADYKEADLCYYDTHNIQAKEKMALKILQEFRPDYFSISWGKDSVVLAHLAFRYDKNSELAHFTHKADALYFDEVRDCFLSRYQMNYHEYSKDIKEIINEFYDFHKHNIKNLANRELGKKYVTGIRMQESAQRKITVRKNGLYSNNSCRPIAYWTDKEIFAYLAHYDLPVHPNYAMLGGGRFDRDKIRVGPMWMGSQYGNELWEREYYGDILNRLSVR